ncbi:MAG TPA: tetratricopeptide repeat protein [Terracidiphilus sp.]|nr:tetratricopeptide repeat protein [Terracidiphilus sp.]
MNRRLMIALLLGSAAAMPQHSGAQASTGNGQSSSQNQPAPDQQKPNANPPKNPGEANPFPTDTTSVPVMPSRESPGTPAAGSNLPAYSDVALPNNDADPVRSPDDAMPAPSSSSESSSSDAAAGLDELLRPPPDATKGRRPAGAPPAEGPQVDENVGSYYLEAHDWKGALSRFQSALVLDPENPDVYWGLAEAQRHLGDFANAKTNYLKVIEFDPDSKHSKDAKKILKQPEIANARAGVNLAAPPEQPQK